MDTAVFMRPNVRFMKKSIGTLIFVILVSIISVSAQKNYCFENNGLKGTSSILFTVSGNKIINGEFTTSVYDESASKVKSSFIGTKSGKNLNIKFTGKVPEEFSTIKKITWTLGKSLKIQMYGKNYNTNKWSLYWATFTGCDIN